MRDEDMETKQINIDETDKFANGKESGTECEKLELVLASKSDNLIGIERCDFENPDHLKALAELINHYMADPMGNFEPLNKLQQLRLVDGLAQHPTAEVVFAIVDAKVVGLATCFVNFSTFQVKPYLYIHDIVVLETYRGQGIAKALMKHLIKMAEERKYCKLTLEVRTDNAKAQGLYKNLGFAECDPQMLFWSLPLMQK
jgi:ribosomal protein S18 acetylase RimI-like enzyme